ncbi:MAG: hypothetical protein L6Q54_13795 [Leptospiraceae bacterium]|nr:hypothetical protein [Leptospiraceae bacterium]MCK6382307.1 hypothetical protein [Leptospiraceae bacterium]NUM42425.1 hypothetical protein [Leptospiraceae bacterium]
MNKKVLKIYDIVHNASNSTEIELKKVLKSIIKKNPNWGWEQISFQDVYACAINSLPVNYQKKDQSVQSKLNIEEVEKVVQAAMHRISLNPIHLPQKK